MKQKLRLLFVIGLTVAMTQAVCGQEQKDTFGDKLKRFFARPTPTATPPRTRGRSSPSPTIAPPSSVTSVPQEEAAAIPSATEPPMFLPEQGALTVIPSVQAESEYFEPVRPISPGPHSRMQTTPQIHALQTTPIPSATATEIPEISVEESSEPRPTPSLPSMIGSRASPVPKTTLPTPVTVSVLESYPADVGRIVDFGMDLTMENLPYKYASADPANGGMDCSGFIYYVLTKGGVRNVPRDAREQYIWVRKAGNFQSVLARRDDTFELDALRPGNLLFWADNSGVSRDPEITKTMIYIGRDKTTSQRLMIGASERSTYKGEDKSGVSVFDFRIGSAEPKSDGEATSVFVGYGRVPGLSGD